MLSNSLFKRGLYSECWDCFFFMGMILKMQTFIRTNFFTACKIDLAWWFFYIFSVNELIILKCEKILRTRQFHDFSNLSLFSEKKTSLSTKYEILVEKIMFSDRHISLCSVIRRSRIFSHFLPRTPTVNVQETIETDLKGDNNKIGKERNRNRLSWNTKIRWGVQYLKNALK